MEIYPAKSKFWEPIKGETFNSFLYFVKNERGIKDPHDINIIENNAVNILKKCVYDEKTTVNSTKRTILHLGEVQSGKTLAMCSVIALAYDNDFLISTVLTGTKNILKSQNQNRIKEVLDPIDSGNKKFIYYSEPNEKDQLNTQLGDLIKENKFIKKKKMIVFTMLKHQSKINKLSKIFTKQDLRVDQFPIKSLILDDEADQASPNTKGRKNEKENTKERSSINQSIINLRESHSKFCTYIQVTATANPLFLISNEDPMNPDYISISKTPKAYIGIKNYFQTKKKRAGFVIKIEESDIPDPDDKIDAIPKALREAIDYYIVATATCETLELDKPLNPPFTMLCHPDWRKGEHDRYDKWIRKYINGLKDRILNNDTEEEGFKELEKSFKKVMKHLDIDLTFEKIKKNVGMIIESNISIRIINDKNPITDDLEDFWNLSNYHIIIGGNCIERGFTVEGIIVTYMSRDPGKNADSIQQRARFCGFKNNYHFLLSRLWLDETNIKFFKNYIFTEDAIRRKIEPYIDEFKPHAKAGLEIPIVKPFQLTRNNVHGELNIGDAGEWFKPKFGQYLTKEDQEENLKIFNQIFSNFHSTFSHPNNSTFRCFESNNLKISDLKEILKKYRTFEAENAPKIIYEGLIDCFPDEYDEDENITTFFMVDTDFQKYLNLKEYIKAKNKNIFNKRNFKFPAKNQKNIPTTNLHRGAGLKQGINWTADNQVVSREKITLQIYLVKYGISNDSDFNEKVEIHNEINKLTNNNETMSICIKFPDLSSWRVISQ